MAWNSKFIEDIHLRRRRERDFAPEMAQREDSLLKLMSRSLYGEKVHYALELIQNAEDAYSSSITFVFEKDKIIVINDGAVFVEDDVDAICSVKPGRKKNKIGFFGVGFKSVFNVTNTPQVISSEFNFLIENYIYPSPSDRIPESASAYYSRDKGSIFVQPQSEGLPTIPELIENFKEIDDKILLFLPNLSALHFVDNVNGEKWSIEKPATNDDYILLKDGRTGQETKWRVFHKDLPVLPDKVPIPEGKAGITDTRIILAFPCDSETRKNNTGSTVYCYLPTRKRSDMPFLVQADFVPTLGRADIQDVEWNKWLLAELGILAAEAIDQLKNDANLSKEIYSFIPLKEEVQEPLMSILSNSMYDSLKDKDISKTLYDGWKRPSECVIALNDKIPDLVSQQDLKQYFKRNLSYVDVELPDRAKIILEELGSQIFGEENFISFLENENLIKSRKPEWFLRTYEYLGEIFDVDKKDYAGNFAWNQSKLELFSKLDKTKFLLTNRGNIVPLKDPQMPDRLICFPQNIDLAEINQLLIEGEIVFLNKYFQLSTIIRRKEVDPKEEERRKKVHKFFDGIGIRIYFKQAHVIKDVLLSKYSSGKYEQYDDQKLFKFISYIRMYWGTLESEVKNKKLSDSIFDEIRETILLRAYTKKNGERIACYMPPDKLYFPKRYGPAEAMEDLFDDVENIFFLHPYYLNREKHTKKKKKRGRQKTEYGWKRFAEILGVWSSPSVEKSHDWVSIRGNSRYDWVKREYSPSRLHELREDSYSEDVVKLIEYCSELEDGDAVRQRVNMLLQSLSENWSKYREHCRAVYKYKYHSEYHKDLNSSSFLNYLRNAEWIPTEEGDFCKPEEVYIANRRNHFLLAEKVKYAKLTGNQTFLKDIGINLEPTIRQVIDHLKEYKENNASLERSELPKFETIYLFIAEKTRDLDSDAELAEEIKEDFEDNELVYIPRKDNSWWKPSEVFWKDQSRTFGNLRGYIEYAGKEIYSSKVKDFFLSLGISEQPSIAKALEVLNQLRVKNDMETLRKAVTEVYSYINDLISHDGSEDIDWSRHSFLTREDEFLPAKEIYFEDDEEFPKEFYDKAKFIHIPHSSWINFRSFLEDAGFNSFTANLSTKKHLGNILETEGSAATNVIRALELATKYLLRKHLEGYEALEEEGTFDDMPTLEVYDSPQIKLDLALKKNELQNITVKGIEREAYYSKEENRLYILTGTKLLSGIVAKELSRIFKWAGKEVFPFLNSILPVVEDDEALAHQLFLFGIEEKEEAYERPDKVELWPEEEKPETEQQETEQEPEEQPEEKKVKPPEPPKPRKGLIDPDEYYPSTANEYEPYKDLEGGAKQIPKEIDLKEGKPGEQNPPREPPTRMGRKDAEGTAIQIVLNYEASQGRSPEDRHMQRGIGYDVYSKTPEGDEMFIEVKHFGEDEGPFELKPHQSKKAELEQNKYYVYIVKGLKEGTTPKIFIIQNPIQLLTPDPPIQKIYSQWKNAVKTEIEFEKA